MSLATKASSVVACWPLDEASGNAVETVNGYSGTETGGTIGTGTGIVSATARDFEDADTEWFEVADNADISMGNNSFGIRVWVNLESKGATRMICAKGSMGSGADLEYALMYSSGSDRFVFYMDDHTFDFANVAANNLGSPSAGVWYLIHARYDADTDTLGIAVNAGTEDTASYTGGCWNGSDAFRIGYDGSAVRYYDGLINDLVLLKNNYLDATERTEDYNGGAGVAFADWAGAASASPPPFHRSQRFFSRRM